MKEVYIPKQNRIFQYKSFEPKLHRSRGVLMINVYGEEVYDQCCKCGKKFDSGDEFFYGYKNKHGEFVVRKYYYTKICPKCGFEILEKMIPKNLLNSQSRPLKCEVE